MKSIASAVILFIAGIAGTATAADLKPGDTVQASNLDARQTDTFEGHKISDLLTDRMQTLIRDEGLVITLAASKPVVLGKDYMAATKANAGKATYNQDTRLVE